MHYGIEVIPFGEFGDPRIVVHFAQAAEAAGWEGLFVWDHVLFAAGVGDPWVIHSAVAASTQQIKVGTNVAPLPRYRPHLLARTLTALDILSQGRVILGVGLGAQDIEFMAFGETGDMRTRAAMTDEGLELLTRLWSEESVTHHGEHYTFDDVTLLPRPVQRPRIPIWIGGESKPALRRAARWDGWIIGGIDPECEMIKTPEQLAAQVSYIGQHRIDDAPFEVAMTGCSTPADGAMAREYGDAGLTWWLESIFELRGSFEEMLARIQDGPPR